MPRYITVEDALNAMCDNCDAAQAVCPHYPCKRYTAIESIPTADVQEMTLETAIDYLHKVGWMQEHDRILTESAKVKQGKWIKLVAHHRYYNTERTVCSECGGEPFEWDNSGEWLSEYCPHCGAKMRGEEDDC